MARIGVLGTTLAVTSNRRTMIKETLRSSETSCLTRANGVASQKTPFFIDPAVKTSNLTNVSLKFGAVSHSETYGYCKASDRRIIYTSA
jgi:hypothetical protein